MAQNLMSVAGAAIAIVAAAAVAAGAADVAVAWATGAAPPPMPTALSWPVRPVDFSTWVALRVRR